MSTLNGTCPICDATLTVPANTLATEMLSCSECFNMLVVTTVSESGVEFEEAPEVEEDWGE